MFTAEEWAVAEFGSHIAGVSEYVDDAFVYEVHLGADGALSDDVVARQEHLVLQLRHYLGHEVRVGVCKKRNGRNQCSAVVVYDLLKTTAVSGGVWNLHVYHDSPLLRDIECLRLPIRNSFQNEIIGQ